MMKGRMKNFVFIAPVLLLMAGILTQTVFYLNKPRKINTSILKIGLEGASTISSEQEKSIPLDKLSKSEFIQKFRKLQIPFIENEGQVDGEVNFYTKTFGGTVYITKKGEIFYSLPMKNLEREIEDSEQQIEGEGSNEEVCRSKTESRNHQQKINQKLKEAVIVLKEEIVGAQVGMVQGEQPSVTKVNYFKGNEPSQWKTDVSTYNEVNLGDIYEGIGLKLRTYGNNVEKIFCVKPGADPDQISMQFCGVKSIKKNEEGFLEVDTELGSVFFTKPVAYQEIDGKREIVEAEYAICNPHSFSNKNTKGDNVCGTQTYSFAVASYDRTKDLIIDPLLASTFLGGNSDETGYSIAIDSEGNVYVTGYTYSTDFPTVPGTYDTSHNGDGDVFVSKLNSDLTSVLASTFLGGNGFDSPRNTRAMVIDTGGNVYVGGYTTSLNFPTTLGAYDRSYDTEDIFVSKFNGELNNLLASTLLGGSATEEFGALTLDDNESIYVSGRTHSSNFPTTAGAYDNSYNGGGDVFVSKLNGDLTSLLASTYLGGGYTDTCYSLAIDAEENLYMGGPTQSPDFPTTSGGYDTSFNSISNDDPDVFISKMDGALTNLIASTYLGGSLSDGGIMLLDPNGNVFVVGTTHSSDFPTMQGAYDISYNSGGDVFVSKLDEDLTSLLASTYVGGTLQDAFYAVGSMAIDSNANVCVFGTTFSTDFPITPGGFDTSFNGGNDAFVLKLNNNLTNMLASTYLGGTNEDHAYGITTDSLGNIYVTGGTYSHNFPTISGSYDRSFNGGSNDPFVAKLDGDISASATAIELDSFSAIVDDNGSVNLIWETATEIDNVGFNIYRARRKDGRYKKINDELIDSKGDAVDGATYNFVDTPGHGIFFYKLEDMDSSGATTMHGPIKVRIKSIRE